MTSIQLLKSLSAQVSLMIQETEKVFLVLPEDTLNQAENKASWSILQCYEHLNRYCRYYNKAIGEKIKSGDTRIDHEVNSTWLGKKSIQAMHPSNQKKQKTLRHLNPVQTRFDRNVIEEFLLHQCELLELLDRAGTTNLNNVKIPVEFFRLLKMNLGDALQFLVVHQQRHFNQLNRILNATQHQSEIFLKV